MAAPTRAAGSQRSTADRAATDSTARRTDPSHERREKLRHSQRRDPGTGSRSAAEWITLSISAFIVLALIGLTSYFSLTAPGTPAQVEVEPRLAETRPAGTHFYLPIVVRNTGGETGEEVRIRVTLTDPAGRAEESELLFQFLAGGSSARAVVAFTSDPRLGNLQAGVISYLEP